MGKNFISEFKNPSSEFRGAPFWAWNGKLNKDTLIKQIGYFREMGMGGFTMHPRTGFDTPYLGEEHMEMIRACVDKAKEYGMKACLYDEDRWPSGYAGGEVTKEKRFRCRYIVFSPYAPGEDYPGVHPTLFASTPPPKGSRELLARYDVCLEDGYLVSYRELSEGETGDHTIWYAYLEVTGDNPWFNHQSYVDVLNKEAIERFIEITHETYKTVVGDEFGKTVPSIFTDEPEYVIRSALNQAEDRTEISIPYTESMEDGYRNTYGESFFAHLPEIFWELPDGRISVHRYRYHDYLTEMFACAYADTIGGWCKNNNIALTGHMQDEDRLENQTRSIGEAMRHYRGFGIPGVDILCDSWEFATVKQAQSAAHQLGAGEITSELYGVTNWDFDFRGHKQQGDWQSALGVTHRVHHHAWMTMAGEAKRDYPGSIFYQSPWYSKYPLIEDYFARVNTVLRSGKPEVRVGVIHPIESYWLVYGPKDQTAEGRNRMQTQFEQITHWLLFGQIDFDFISEGLLRDMPFDSNGSAGFCAGEMKYDAVIIPGCLTLRGTTIERLEAFRANGGTVIFMGEAPQLIDAMPSNRAAQLAGNSVNIRFDRIELLDALREYRLVDIRNMWGGRCDNYIYQMRTDGENRILFIANGRKTQNRDIPRHEDLIISVKGKYTVTVLDAMSGEKKPLEAEIRGGNTVLKKRMYDQDSLLLYLTAGEPSGSGRSADTGKTDHRSFVCTLNTVRSFRLCEPNVLVLDQAEYGLDHEPLNSSEEILRIDNFLRGRLGWMKKPSSLAQPWCEPQAPQSEKHILKLRYAFYSEIEVPGVMLAIEPGENMKLWLNGDPVGVNISGYYVDECIKTIPLPTLKAGDNELIVTMDYSEKSSLECCFLLGDFHVRVFGNRASILPVNPRIGFSDLTAQGMPFYGGNVTYCCDFNVEEGTYSIEIAKFRAPLIEVHIDGKLAGPIAFSPYRVSLGHLSAGAHRVEITAYGNRVNTFGVIHNCDHGIGWIDPNAWRMEGNYFSYEYQPKPTGILAAPRLFLEEASEGRS